MLFRMIVIRRNITPMLPHLEDILSDKEKEQYHKEILCNGYK